MLENVIVATILKKINSLIQGDYEDHENILLCSKLMMMGIPRVCAYH